MQTEALLRSREFLSRSGGGGGHAQLCKIRDFSLSEGWANDTLISQEVLATLGGKSGQAQSICTTSAFEDFRGIKEYSSS